MTTIDEFLIAVDIEVDKTIDYELPYIQPEQKMYWLNIAQDRLISQKLFGNNPKGTVYDLSQERVDNIRTLIKTTTISPGTNGGYGSKSYIFTLPEDYRYFDKFTSSGNRIGLNGSTFSGIFNLDIINRSEIDLYTTIPGVNKPELFKLKGFIEGDNLIVISDAYTTLTNGILRYIKIPTKFTDSSITDLPEHLHQEIVSEAVALILNSFESPRVGMQTELNKIRE